MSKLYSSEYKEINVNYLLKNIVKSKILILIVILFTTLFSVFWAYSLEPVYESRALLKIGHYHVVDRHGGVTRKELGNAPELVVELEFLYYGKGDEQAEIVKVERAKNIQNYIEIVSEGITPEHSSNVIKNLVRYVQKEHAKMLLINREKHIVAFRNTDISVSGITKKQQELLSKEKSFQSEDYASLLNTMQLMSIIDIELGVGYIGQILERKEKLELLLGDKFEQNTALVGEIHSPKAPTTIGKMVIIIIGFIVGIFLSIAAAFFRIYFSEQQPK